MLNNYYTSEGKYIEYMSASDICNSTTNYKLLHFIFPTNRDTIYTIVNKDPPKNSPLEYIIGTLPKNTVIKEIDFSIISTDQRTGNKDGTKYELVLKYGNIDHPLTNKIWCVDFITPNSDNFIGRINHVSGLIEYKPFIKIENTDVKLSLKLYNLNPGHNSTIVGYSIHVRYFN